MGSGIRAVLVFAGGIVFTAALAIGTSYNLFVISLGVIGSMLFALREGFTTSAEATPRAREHLPTRWIWLVGVVALTLLTAAPVLGAYTNTLTPVAATGGSGGGSSSGGSALAPTCGNPCVIIIANSKFGSGSQLQSGNGYVVVKVGTTVIWENHDNTQHTTTSTATPPIWDSGILNPGQQYNHTFTATGTFDYICNVHPMAGTVVVVS